MSIPTSFMMLKGAEAGFNLFNRTSDYSDQTSDVYAKYDAAYRQSGAIDSTTYNQYLHLGHVQRLEAKKHALSLFDLYRVARRTKSAEIMKINQQAGSTSQVGVKRLQVLDYEIHAAATRKNENFETGRINYLNQIKRTTLENISKKNQVFTGLSSLPSETGFVSGIAGDVISSSLSIGYGTNKDGKIFSRVTGS